MMSRTLLLGMAVSPRSAWVMFTIFISIRKSLSSMLIVLRGHSGYFLLKLLTPRNSVT